jgi:outer membrane protein assembly factor BamD (BamD/ComL family)
MPHCARILRASLPIWLLLLAAGCRTGTAKGPPDQLLADGKKFYEEKGYKEAARNFRGVGTYHKETEQAEEALFLLAESTRHLRYAEESFDSYEALAERYPNSRYAVGAAMGEYKLGMAHFGGKMPGFLFFGTEPSAGIKVLEHMQVHYRNHSLADDALMQVADFQMGEKDFEDAAYTLRRLLSVYPRSEHTLRARYQLARCLWHENRGPLYDEQVLRDSRRAFRDFIGTVKLDGLEDQYPDQIASAQKMMEAIDERLAEKLYLVGRFYERTGNPSAAVYYYRLCIRDYSRAKFAEESNQRMAKLAGVEPAKPQPKEEVAG